ncbi:MAG TPA: hypothetical protein VHK47_08400 [Polyangia bacterium]|nr:hypothetical protein [Polyangia bacterium]
MNAEADEATDDGELRRESDRIVQLIEDLGAMAGAPVRQRAEELAQRLVHLYGAGLERLMSIWEATGRSAEADARLHADPLVSSLLVLHDLHPVAAAARDYDLGPGAGRAAPPSGLVQIDLSRSRGGGEPP